MNIPQIVYKQKQQAPSVKNTIDLQYKIMGGGGFRTTLVESDSFLSVFERQLYMSNFELSHVSLEGHIFCKQYITHLLHWLWFYVHMKTSSLIPVYI